MHKLDPESSKSLFEQVKRQVERKLRGASERDPTQPRKRKARSEFTAGFEDPVKGGEGGDETA